MPPRPESNLNAQQAPTARGRPGPPVNGPADCQCSERVELDGDDEVRRRPPGPAYGPVVYFAPQHDPTVTIDINKCRKNILYNGEFNCCLFAVFDKVDKFKGTKIKPGFYYVETDNNMPLRSNVWYYHNMTCYCIKKNIVTLDNIKYVIKSSLSLQK
jgi:hypothetical protein